jgi:hypothetical protein
LKGHRDLIMASAGAVLCALVAVLIPLEIVRIAAAIPLTLFLPGYAIVAASFGSRALAPAKRLTLSVAVSLMCLALASLVLNAFPFGLTTLSWALLLVIVVLAASLTAALRRGAPMPPRRRVAIPLSPAGVAVSVIALLAAIAALALAQRPLPAKNAIGFTALWMLPLDAREEAVEVGVQSNEQGHASYTLRVAAGRGGGTKRYAVSLDPGEERTYRIAVPRAGAGTVHVVASLYRQARPGQVFRQVDRWLPRRKTLP